MSFNRWRFSLLIVAAALLLGEAAPAADRGMCLQGACNGDVDCNDRCLIDAPNPFWVTCGSFNHGVCCFVTTTSQEILGIHVTWYRRMRIVEHVRTEYVCPSGSRTVLSDQCREDEYGLCLDGDRQCCHAATGWADCGGADHC